MSHTAQHSHVKRTHRSIYRVANLTTAHPYPDCSPKPLGRCQLAGAPRPGCVRRIQIPFSLFLFFPACSVHIPSKHFQIFGVGDP